jgi:glycosyltransferase involved in cell wall biosynthesis
MTIAWLINDSVNNNSKSIGWVQGYLEQHYTYLKFKLYIIFPTFDKKKLKPFEKNHVFFYPFFKPRVFPFINILSEKSNKKTVISLKRNLNLINPDLLHIFGTEFDHSLLCAKLFNKPKFTLVHIQGLVSEIAKVYTFKIPNLYKILLLPNDFFKGNILFQRINFHNRGKTERNLLKFISNVAGRTNWDKAVVKKTNSNISYHHINESLRNEFYDHNTYDFKICHKRITIFINQASYPIKGLHTILKNIAQIKNNTSFEILVKIGGKKPFSNNIIYNFLYMSSYGYYLKRLINKYSLENTIIFLGRLNPNEVRNELQNCNIFLSPSIIENSSNAIGEAIMMNKFILASNVGGTPSILKNYPYSFLYDINNENSFNYIFLDAVSQLKKLNEPGVTFNSPTKNNYDREKNYQDLIRAYENILSK